MRILAGLISLTFSFQSTAPPLSPAVLMDKVAHTAMERWPSGDLSAIGYPQPWQYQKGTLLEGMEGVWNVSRDPAYFAYIKSSVDRAIDDKGKIKDFPGEPHSLDQILMGRQALLLLRVTSDQRYARAARQVRAELAEQPRTKAGGFWHKQIYPNQMWLDGLYMAEPFYAEYAATFKEPADFKDIARQFVLVERKTLDPRTGLLRHGWDESKQQPWANRETGQSPEVWSRAMGWYAMALVDTLPYFPARSPERAQLLAILQRVAASIVRYQDPKTGVWFEVMDKAKAPGNFNESSASCMFVYALFKAVRLGYLPESVLAAANAGWRGIEREFVELPPDGSVHLNHIVKGAGLGGTPYRSGTYEYYVGEKVVSDEPKGTGAFLLAASEAVRASSSSETFPRRLKP